MTQAALPGGQELRAEIIRARRAGLPVDRKDAAARHRVSQRTVAQVVAGVDKIFTAAGLPEDDSERQEIALQRVQAGPADLDRALAAITSNGVRRIVPDFDGSRLYSLRSGGTGLWLTQEQVGILAGKSRGEIGHLEREQRKPTIPTLRYIANALGVSPSALLRTGKDANGQATG